MIGFDRFVRLLSRQPIAYGDVMLLGGSTS